MNQATIQLLHQIFLNENYVSPNKRKRDEPENSESESKDAESQPKQKRKKALVDRRNEKQYGKSNIKTRSQK